VVRYEPIGVAALIIPWNYPMLMAAWKVAPALAAGCSVVLKPSELTPITALELAVIIEQCGVPAGVFNVVTGYGHDAGDALARHPLVDKVAFTGSAATGSKIMAACAADIKKVTLELGGKSPIVVFDDVDIAKAVEWVMFGIFWTNGQICSATSRLILQDTIADKFLLKLKEETDKMTIGDPLTNPSIGPLVSQGQYERVLGFIDRALKAGVKVLTGGGRPAHLKDDKGYYVSPTILTNVSTDSEIWSEEVFGPVLVVHTFHTEQEAIVLANMTKYGLGGAVLSNDESRCKRLVRAVRAGVIWVNCSQPCFCQGPWGGFKRSGVGRELGPWGMDNYLEVKQVTTYVAPVKWGWYSS